MPKTADTDSSAKDQLRDCIFEVTAYVTRMELSARGRRLIVHYFNEARRIDATARARGAVERYAQVILPSLEEIRGRADALSALDHLLLRMDHAARGMVAHTTL